jgi:type IV pilus assembly protein PilM
MAQGAVLGLDIGTRMIKFCEIGIGRQGPELLSYGVCPTPPEVISTGVIVDPAELGGTIRDLLSSSGARSRRVHCVVTSLSSLVVKVIPFPRMSDEELPEAMRWEIERYIPWPPGETIVDYKHIQELDQLPADLTNMPLLLAAGEETMINALVQTLLAAKLEPLSLDVEPLAASRALVDINADLGAYNQVFALVNIGAASTEVNIIDKGNIVLTRSLTIGGDQLTNAIAEGLGKEFDEAERLKVEAGLILFDPALYRPALQQSKADAQPPPPAPSGPPQAPPLILQRAEAIIEEQESGGRKTPVFDLGKAAAPPPPPPIPSAEGAGLPQIPTSQSLGDSVGKRIFESMAPELAEMVRQIRQTLDYYNARASDTGISKVLVFGGTARLPHFDLFLTNELGVTTELADPFQRIQTSAGEGADPELKALAPMLTIAVGMGIRDMLE